tara:strand:- start:806 stop:1651 length:846 start_codon:yes stop_codon:yes gene_type:complete
MASISGQSTSNIDGVDGFFTTSGGGTASTTPTLSISVTPIQITLTISNYGSYTNPNWEASVFVGATEVVTNAEVTRSIDSNLLSATLTWSADLNASTSDRTVKVRAQEFGDFIQSAEATIDYAPQDLQSRFVRFRGVDSAGADSSDRLGIMELRLYTAAGQTGTEYPTTNLSSNTSETGIVTSQGHVYSATYAAWKACDGSTGTFAWLLGTSAANNWWEIEFESATYPTIPIIKSLSYRASTNQQTDWVKIEGSDTGAFAGEEVDYGLYYIPGDGTTTLIG